MTLGLKRLIGIMYVYVAMLDETGGGGYVRKSTAYSTYKSCIAESLPLFATPNLDPAKNMNANPDIYSL